MNSASALSVVDIAADAADIVAADGPGHSGRGATSRLRRKLEGKGLGTVPPWKLAESLRRARHALYGDMASLDRLQRWLEALKAADIVDGVRDTSDTFVNLLTQVDDDRKRHYFRLFIAPGPGVRISRAAPIKNYLTYDGTFCKYRFIRARRVFNVKMGCVLTLIASDGDGSLLPLAIGHCEGETRDTWVWFFEQCKVAFGDDSVLAREGVILSADGDKGGVGATEQELPWANRMFCLKHRQVRVLFAMPPHPTGVPHPRSMCVCVRVCVRACVAAHIVQRNLAKWLGRNATDAVDAVNIYDAFTAAATANSAHRYRAHMDTLADYPEAYAYIMQRPPNTWAVSQMPVCCFGKFTSNDAESFNSTFSLAKNKLPLLKLLQAIIDKVYTRYNAGARTYLRKHRRGDAAGTHVYTHRLPERAARALRDAQLKSQRLEFIAGGDLDGRTVSRHGNGVQVTHQVDVDMPDPSVNRGRVCTCGMPAATGSVCLHAVRVAAECEVDPVDLVHPLLLTSSVRSTYEAMGDARLPGDEAWSIGDIPEDQKLLLPMWMARAGAEEDERDEVHPALAGRLGAARRIALHNRATGARGAEREDGDPDDPDHPDDAGAGDDRDDGSDEDAVPLWRLVGNMHAGRCGYGRRASRGEAEQRAILRLSQQARDHAANAAGAVGGGAAGGAAEAVVRPRRRRRTHHCSNCRSAEHNVRRCAAPCGACGGENHKRRRCPRLGRAGGAAQEVHVRVGAGGGAGTGDGVVHVRAGPADADGTRIHNDV